MYIVILFFIILFIPFTCVYVCVLCVDVSVCVCMFFFYYIIFFFLIPFRYPVST